MSRVAALAAAFAVIGAAVSPVRSAEPDRAPDKSIDVARAAEAPVIDGQLTDASWRQARFISDFRQREPVENGLPTRRTAVAFAYDQDALYVAARMFTAGPGEVQAVMTRRDETGTAERIIVSLDTFRDRRTAYSFAVTAAGVQADWYHPDDADFPRDPLFDPVWQAAVTMHRNHWTAEMRIPFSQLRFAPADEHRWGININRFIPQRNEDIFWIVVPKHERGWASHFGELRGIRNVHHSARIELKPYTALDTTITSRSLFADDDPFADEFDLGARAGLDAKLGLGPSLTLDATINPDFGQVEADPAVVNLSAFETVFDERRPFFVEGAQILKGRGATFFYSRRIGAPPRGSVEVVDSDDPGESDEPYSDAPTSTPILGAAKLTGRLPSGLFVGVLSALTRPAYADVADSANPSMRLRVPVEPLTTFNVLRLEREVGQHSSRIGASLTGVYRHFPGDDPSLDSFLPLDHQLVRHAIAGGLDWNLRLAQARYEINGNVGFSTLGGESQAIAERQTDNSRYLQRPDQDHVSFDPTRRSLSGWLGEVSASKRSGAWRWTTAAFAQSPGFAANDLGLLVSADDVGFYADLFYLQRESGTLYHSWELGLFAFEEWNFGGVRKPADIDLHGRFEFRNYWRVDARLSAGTPGHSDDLTRGGPLMGIGWRASGDISLANSSSARQQWWVEFDWDASETGPTGFIASARVTARPVDRIQLSLSPRYLRRTNNRQYIETIDDPNAAEFGQRYLFAEVKRRELALQTRLHVSFTPNLSAELYAEPFASSGRFSHFGELAEAGSRDLRRYGRNNTEIELTDDPDDADQLGDTYTVTDRDSSFAFDNPDFTLLSFRSTLVLRWEFLPGSTMFLVWQQNRTDELLTGNSVSLGDVGESITSPGQHTLAVKISYYWPAL
ncbi:MAG: carbohydrate binding family 9 domain-containing protein [Proteobacteria bacterium]|nr:carbohydrate binding family 9 domain-containing protein [Pseudomonadota bacterium]